MVSFAPSFTHGATTPKRDATRGAVQHKPELPPIVGDVLQAGGQLLDAATRALMEPRFGHDFSRVKVHADDRASQAARSIQAHAFTHGEHIVFARGRYGPSTPEGARLLSHELAHVVQQTASARPSSNFLQARVSDPSDLQERLAERAADEVLAGREATALGLGPTAVSAVLQRDAAPAENAGVEADHTATQRMVYAWLAPNGVWSRARRGAKPTDNLAPEEKVKDPDVLFDNSVGWLRSGAVTLTVLTLAPGQTGTEARPLYFDPDVNYPNVGGSAANTVAIEKGEDAKTDLSVAPPHVRINVKPGFTETRLRELLRHEIQHVADAHASTGSTGKADEAAFGAEAKGAGAHGTMSATIWANYQTEFRAHWLESISRPAAQVGVDERGSPVMAGGSGGTDKFGSEFNAGGELKVSGRPDVKDDPLYVPEASVTLRNEKQTKIANLIIHNYFGMEETFLRSPLFRARVQDLDHIESVNAVNSLRIEHLRRTLHGPPTRETPWLKNVPLSEDLAQAAKALDATDLAFLKDRTASGPFWNDARASLEPALFAWLDAFVTQGH